ncbi:Uncharacterized conserved protein YibQ, putative polysaccharide deacetylase 2 family [Aliiroseovarius halocynthiae]|uniref:Divergent polysaccharide deacetylase family protein n=1 Tax=Aliiroseovarius halocynthiae TaxID=985055 RepID=A0A545SSF1_9RHOB|nr:divergent polysaccharide deacetylase family protein [Aliiroseovarius halocynthiae]TQV67882.1 hypothetical protein FIL88_08535 [Aliiroseovarius halocynthiae]SMR72976.1 Uncharacterized conserved protein YibQ, putative polysaccharide deacetylase 2 family [Aliiroseovarius halocynthiae]
MAKGFLTGVICGGVVSAAGIGLVSPMLPPVKTDAAPVVTEPITEHTPVQSEGGTAQAPNDDVAVDAQSAEPEVEADPVVEAPAPEPVDADSSVDENTLDTPAEQPETEGEEASDAGDVIVPDAPEVISEPEIETAAEASMADDVAQAQPDVIVEVDEPVVEVGEVAADAPIEEVQIPEEPAVAVEPEIAPVIKDEAIVADAIIPATPAEIPAVEAEIVELEIPAEDTPVAEVPVLDAQPEASPDEDVLAEVTPEPTPQTLPSVTDPEVSSDLRAGLGTSVGPLADKALDVTKNRLPSIGDGEQDQGLNTTAAGLEAVLPDLSDSPLAIERNAVPAPGIEGRPLMAIVLADMGPERTQLDSLAQFPFPVSVIVDVNAPDLDAAIQFYRQAGAEIVIQADLPPGATPTDAEVNLQVQQPVLDQGVAVYMPPNSGFQTNAPLSRQISEILIASGHGLISQAEGLNTGHKNALKIGVPAGLVFRELDGGKQNNDVIRRFLDNAAFKADQQVGVILMGRAAPQTLGALVEWSLGSRISSVAMVPVSAVLLGGS